VDKKEVPVVTHGIHPPRQSDFLPAMGRREFPTIYSLLPIHEKHLKILA
jgi:hypothetical protein